MDPLLHGLRVNRCAFLAEAARRADLVLPVIPAQACASDQLLTVMSTAVCNCAVGYRPADYSQNMTQLELCRQELLSSCTQSSTMLHRQNPYECDRCKRVAVPFDFCVEGADAMQRRLTPASCAAVQLGTSRSCLQLLFVCKRSALAQMPCTVCTTTALAGQHPRVVSYPDPADTYEATRHCVSTIQGLPCTSRDDTRPARTPSDVSAITCIWRTA